MDNQFSRDGHFININNDVNLSIVYFEDKILIINLLSQNLNIFTSKYLFTMQDKNKQHFAIITIMVLVAASTRFMMIPNFTAVGAMGLFGAAYFSNKMWAFVVPFAALFFSDLLMNNTIYAQYYEGFTLFGPGVHWTYLGFAAIVLIGMGLLKKIKPLHVVGASMSASVVFFLVSNFGVWSSGMMYSKDIPGLIAAYAAGLPFLQYTMLGDLFFSGVLFGLYEFAVKPRFATTIA
jgi:hypothetical protein